MNAINQGIAYGHKIGYSLDGVVVVVVVVEEEEEEEVIVVEVIVVEEEEEANIYFYIQLMEMGGR